MANYYAWPTQDDVQLLLTSCDVTTRLSECQLSERYNRLLAKVTAEVFRETHRQFLAAGDTRYYDGSGTAEQEVDEMVSLDSVTVIGLQSDPGYTLDNVVLTSEQSLPKTRLIVAQGSLPAYATNAAFLPYRTIFPVGRRNIKVDGTFGFAETIPEDLWEGVCEEIAHRITCEVLFRPIGRILEQKTSETTTHYALDHATITGWHDDYRRAIKKYRRPMGRYLRDAAPRMI